MESPPDPLADVWAMAAQIQSYEAAHITHLVIDPLAWAFVRVPLVVSAAYAPLPFRRRPSKRADRRLRGRIAEALRRA